MRILQVHHINQVANIYGTDLLQRGHSVSIFEPDLVGGLAPLPLKFALMPRRVLDMRRIVGKLNQNYFDIAHIHWASYGILGLASQIPFIVHCHGTDVRDPTFRPILAPIFRRAAAVMGITPDLVPFIQEIRPDAFFFPGPVSTNRFLPVQTKPSSSSQPWTILLFARLDPVKGPQIATEGIAQFARRHPTARVQLLDWGILRGEYKQRYGNRFEFIPLVHPEEVQHMIHSADVVVGQFSLGILSFCELQAMSCAKPVICSFHYDCAYPTPPPLCRATTAEEIDAQLETLFQHPEVGMALGQRSREWVIENHDDRILTGRLEALYQSILS
jgi:glycosyltransferase involved in cell wall biosynthesis